MQVSKVEEERLAIERRYKEVVDQGRAEVTRLQQEAARTAASLDKAGYTDCPATFSLVSGLWTAAFALGNFLGPSLAGLIYDQVPHTSHHTTPHHTTPHHTSHLIPHSS